MRQLLIIIDGIARVEDIGVTGKVDLYLPFEHKKDLFPDMLIGGGMRFPIRGSGSPER